MPEYEIRVLGPTSSIVVQFMAQYLDDTEAEKAARDCANGRGHEVWKGPICIFRAPPDPARFPSSGKE